MIKFYNSIFAVFYRIAVILGNEGVFPEALAYFGASSIIWLNVLTLNDISEIYTHRVFLGSGVLIALYVFSLIMNYFYFLTNNKYERYLDELGKLRYKNGLLVFASIYIVSTFVLYYYFADIRREIVVFGD